MIEDCVPSILRMHLPPTKSVLSIFIFLTSLKTLLRFLPNSLIFLTASSFIALANDCFANFLNLFIYGIFCGFFFFFFICFYFSICISSFAPLFHHHVFKLNFLLFIYLHASSQVVGTHLNDLYESLLL